MISKLVEWIVRFIEEHELVERGLDLLVALAKDIRKYFNLSSLNKKVPGNDNWILYLWITGEFPPEQVHLSSGKLKLRRLFSGSTVAMKKGDDSEGASDEEDSDAAWRCKGKLPHTIQVSDFVSLYQLHVYKIF